MPVSYLLHGLRVTSDVVLPDVAALPHRRPGPSAGIRPDSPRGATSRDADADVRIELVEPRPVGAGPPQGDLLLEHHLRGRLQYAAARTDHGVRFRVPAHADFDVDADLTRITCTPDPGAAEGYLPIMLAGNALSFLLSLAGHAVLHAGAVDVGGSAVAAIGPSGVGKSTLTAWLCAAGGRLVSDDVLRLDGDGTCHRGGREVRLRDRARPLADALGRSGCAVRTTADRRCAVMLPATDAARLPLRAVVVPRPLRDATEVRLHRVDTMTAATLLAGLPRTLGWRIAGPAQAHFTTVTHVAPRIVVGIVDIPWGPPFDPATARRIVELLDIGAHGSSTRATSLPGREAVPR